MIDAFRLINPNMMVLGQEPRQTTSVLGHLQKPSIQALIHGLNRHYYSISINYRKNELEQRMLMNLNKKSWVDGLTLMDYNEHCNLNKVSFVQRAFNLLGLFPAKTCNMSQNTMYNIMRLNGLWLRAHETKSPSAAAGSELSRNRKKITKMKGGFGQLSHGLGPFHTGDLHPHLAVVMARPANYDFFFMIPGARLIPPLSGTDGPTCSSTSYIPWVTV